MATNCSTASGMSSWEATFHKISTVWVDIFEGLKFREYQYQADFKNFEDFNFASRALQYIACAQYSAHVAIVSSSLASPAQLFFFFFFWDGEEKWSGSSSINYL